MTMTFKAILAGSALGLALLVQPAFADKGLVGVSMPEKTTQRWIQDGNNIKKQLEDDGYTVALQYADDDIPTQLAQIEDMITKGAKVLVIAALDGTTLTDVLHQAHEKGIKVIAYDRLIRNSADVDYYATFDNYKVGVIQGTGIADKLGLAAGKGPFNIELFGGSPDDNNAFFFYNGAMSVLDPYIKSGKLVVKSGQAGMEKVGTPHWDGATAQARMENLLSAYYGNAHVDAVLAPNDNLAIGVISAVKGVGYGSGGVALPVVSGQDAQTQSVKSIIAGEQAMTVFKDTRLLAKVTVKMVDDTMAGKTPEVNDTKTYDNGKKIVPSYLLTPVAVDKSNYKALLIDSGYYKESDLK